MNTKTNYEIELLQRFGWVLFDDINRRLGILIEECSHLQQVVHYYGDFEISEHKGDRQREMEHPKLKDNPKDYVRDNPSSHAMEALYEHLGSLIIGLKSLQEEARLRFEAFLDSKDNHDETWFWFIALRSHLLQKVLDQYMMLLEHAHEKLIQTLETKPGQLPQAILLRRWNSSLNGRFLSEYSRHLDWETNELFNNLKCEKNRLSPDELIKARHHSCFIHSWAHTPTSMTTHILVTDTNYSGDNKNFKLGSIRSAFFYLEMPQLYPMLYHECAHMQFNWDKTAVDDDGDFFRTRRNIKKTLHETVEYSHFEKIGGWSNFVDEICADAMAVALGGISYINALAMQIMGQSSGHFFDSDFNTPLQEWTKKPIYDVEHTTTDQYFWEARLKLALLFFKKLPSTQEQYEEYNDSDNQKWIQAVWLGIDTYQQGGEAIFASHRISKQHQDFWQYRKSLNDWVYKTIENHNLDKTVKIPSDKIYSSKYWVTDNDFINNVLAINVRHFEKQFFGKNYYFDDNNKEQECVYPNSEYKYKVGMRIELLVFNVKWYLSKRVIKEIATIKEQKSKNKTIQTFTYTYANFIHDSSAGVFRLALEWLIARNDLIATFADYLKNPEIIQEQFEKLNEEPKFSEIYYLLCKYKKIGSEDFTKKYVINNLRHIMYKVNNKYTKTIYIKDFIRSSEKSDFMEFINTDKSDSNDSFEEKIINFIENCKDTKDIVENFINDIKDNYNLIKLIDDFIKFYIKHNVTNSFRMLYGGDVQHNIGTFTFGTFSKNRIVNYEDNENKQSLYLLGATEVHNYYEDVNKCVNNPEKHCETAHKLHDYKTGSKHTIAGLSDTKENEPSRSSLYFITGDYDFIHHQEGITPSEFTCHPKRRLPILTKSRSVLDLCKHYNKDNLHREPWGRVSLIKFRYRWEMYHLAKHLNKQNYRSRLRLSSAWEDGILITWHKDVSEFWQEAYETPPLSIECALDSQSNLILFKLSTEELLPKKTTRVPITAHDNKEIKYIPILSDETKLFNIIENYTRTHCIFKNAHLSQGRFDYTVEWIAKTPEELASALFNLPASFWHSIEHINTAFGYEFGNYKQPYFISEITAHMFPSIKRNSK